MRIRLLLSRIQHNYSLISENDFIISSSKTSFLSFLFFALVITRRCRQVLITIIVNRTNKTSLWRVKIFEIFHCNMWKVVRRLWSLALPKNDFREFKLIGCNTRARLTQFRIDAYTFWTRDVRHQMFNFFVWTWTGQADTPLHRLCLIARRLLLHESESQKIYD